MLRAANAKQRGQGRHHRQVYLDWLNELFSNPAIILA